MRLDSVQEQLRSWAQADHNIRVMLLTSSRSDPGRKPDCLSDYDVELFVLRSDIFVDDESWLLQFGDIMVREPSRPSRPRVDGAHVWQMVVYESGLRIDFGIWQAHPSASPNLDNYRVLIDKDDLSVNLPEPNYARYVVHKPTEEAFSDRLNAFWWDIIYVAKALKRHELNFAKYMLDSSVRFNKVLPILEWYAGLQNGWSVNPGLKGRWLRSLLDAPTWQAYLRTFAGSSVEDNWRALFATIEFVHTIGESLANELGYPYPNNTDEKVTVYLQKIKDMAWPSQK